MATCDFHGCAIHESLEGSEREKPKACRKPSIGAHITDGPPRKKFLADPNYIPDPHPRLIHDHVRQLEVHANISKVQCELLRDNIKEMEETIAKKTKTVLATSMRVIAYLEETVQVLKLRITNLEETNELLIATLARIPMPTPAKYRQKGDE